MRATYTKSHETYCLEDGIVYEYDSEYLFNF